MSSTVEIKVSYSQVGALLRGTEVKNMLEQEASSIASRCGSGYGHDTKSMGTRVIASVYTESYDAMQDNLDNNTILKAL